MIKSQSSDRIKICLVVTQGERGGAQRYVYDLAANLPKSTYDVIVLLGREKRDLTNRLKELGIRVHELKHLVRNINPLKDILALAEIKRLIETEKPDIVHLNSSKAGVLGSLAAGLAKIRAVVFTAHGFAYLEPHSWPVSQFYFWTEKIASYFRHKIITVSEFDRQAAVKFKLAPPEKLVTIYNGINPSTPLRSAQGLNNLLPEPVEGPIIGTIAHLYPTKGLEYLIEAAHLLTTSYKLQATFLVIGEGKERKKLEARIKKYGLQDRFILAGALPGAQQYLPAFDMFVLPSLKEGFPYSILEAMAAGLPIVAARVGGLPEMITPSLLPALPTGQAGGEAGSPPISRRETGGEEVGVVILSEAKDLKDSIAPTNESELQNDLKNNGILVPPGNPQALAQAIKFLIDNPETGRQLGENAKQTVKKFTIEKMVRETSKIYKEIL